MFTRALTHLEVALPEQFAPQLQAVAHANELNQTSFTRNVRTDKLLVLQARLWHNIWDLIRHAIL